MTSHKDGEAARSLRICVTSTDTALGVEVTCWGLPEEGAETGTLCSSEDWGGGVRRVTPWESCSFWAARILARRCVSA